MANMDYWYDEQIKRYLLQLIRLFSHFQTKEYTSSGIQYNRVPIRYGDSSRLVANILRNNSENVVNSAPFMALTIQDLQLSRERAQDPSNVDRKQVNERLYDPNTNSYSTSQGNLYTVERYMPVPYDLTINLDVWTTSADAKLQILEQIMVLFNPSIQLQSNSNPIDWSNVFEVTLTNTNWTSRSIPQGVDDTLEIATLTFEVPIWISPPAKVKTQSIIHKIIADIHSIDSIADLGYSKDYYDFFGGLDATAQVIITPGDYSLQIEGSTATLLALNGTVEDWDKLLTMSGNITATSQLKLNITNDPEDQDNFIIGTIASHPTEDSQLIFNLDTDTLPTDTIADVDRIIDPRGNYPGDGTLPAATIGDRYLITEIITSAGYANWNIDAGENDIIQYNGSAWFVAFDASETTTVQYVTNAFTATQYKWTGSTWISSYEGVYNPGYFTIVL